MFTKMGYDAALSPAENQPRALWAIAAALDRLGLYEGSAAQTPGAVEKLAMEATDAAKAMTRAADAPRGHRRGDGLAWSVIFPGRSTPQVTWRSWPGTSGRIGWTWAPRVTSRLPGPSACGSRDLERPG